MARQPEAKFYDRIKPKLEALPNTWIVRVQQVSNRGTPDILLCVNGYFVALELKKDSKAQATALQRHNIERINSAGGMAVVVSPENWDAVYEKLKLHAKGNIW